MLFRSLLLITVFFAGYSSLAKEVAGVELEEVARLSVGNTELVLNGSAVRREARHAVYVGGLYLKEPTSSFEEIIADTNHKRFLFYCNTQHISSEKLIDAWEQGFAINYSKDELLKLNPMISTFNQVWASGLKVGDEVWVDFIPNEGTRISVNGSIVAEIDGDEFYHAFLKTWLGPHPFNQKMKQALLGK